MKKIFFIIILIIAGFLIWKSTYTKSKTTIFEHTTPADSPLGSGLSATNDPNVNNFSNYEKLKEKISDKYKNITPKIWSETAPGVLTKLNTSEKVLALTFDACGSTGDGFDSQLINYLSENKIPATLFISGKWIDKNPENFKTISQNSNFEIENHGTSHVPCSVNGQSAYGIQGTKNVGEAVDEMEKNAEHIETLTGRKPKFYRVATTFTDEICPEIANDLEEKIVSFSVNGDGGATYNADQMKNVILKASAGSIILMHMNHPERNTAEGVMSTIPELKKEGFKFVKLEDYQLN